MPSFYREINRRNVVKVAVAYAIVGWILVEVASVFLPGFEAPEWVFKVVMFLVILGFPMAVVFAWAFEITPEGLKREKDVDRSESITPQTGRKLDRIIIALLVVALGYFVATHDWKGEPEVCTTNCPSPIVGSSPSVALSEIVPTSPSPSSSTPTAISRIAMLIPDSAA